MNSLHDTDTVTDAKPNLFVFADAASVSKKEHCIKGVPVKVYHLPADLGGTLFKKEERSEENGNRSYHNAASNNASITLF